MENIYKSFSVETKAVDIDAGIFEAMISTESTDRDGDIIRANGAKLENYLKNPVVLWAHDYRVLPVAKSISIDVMSGIGIKSVFQFPEWGVNLHADTVRRLWAAGFLNATSIGFRPLKWSEVEGGNRYGYDFEEWELLEFSIVPVPANQDALRLALKAIKSPLDTEPNANDNDKRQDVITEELAVKILEILERLKEVLK